MKCPSCRRLIEYSEISIEGPEDQRDPYFDVNVTCDEEEGGCGTEFYYRIKEDMLVKTNQRGCAS